MEISEIITKNITDLIKQIQTNIVTSGKTASGRTKNSLSYEEVEPNHFIVTGAAHFETLEKGRPAGKVPHRFSDIIKLWAVDKGLFAPTDKNLSSFAYFTAKKIADYGTEQHRLGKRTDIYSDAIKDFVQKTERDVSDFYKLEINKLIK